MPVKGEQNANGKLATWSGSLFSFSSFQSNISGAAPTPTTTISSSEISSSSLASSPSTRPLKAQPHEPEQILSASFSPRKKLCQGRVYWPRQNGPLLKLSNGGTALPRQISLTSRRHQHNSSHSHSPQG